MAMKKAKLAELLLRRKELSEKVDGLRSINKRDLFEVKVRRQPITDSVDDIVAEVPMLSASQVMAEYDWHARRLRMVDAAIQQANWVTEVSVDSTVLDDYKAETPVRK